MDIDASETLPVEGEASFADSLLACNETLDDRLPANSPTYAPRGVLEGPSLPGPDQRTHSIAGSDVHQATNMLSDSSSPSSSQVPLLTYGPAEPSLEELSADDSEREPWKTWSPVDQDRPLFGRWGFNRPGFSHPSQFEPSGVGAGLVNLGLTCFVNSVLQCFTHTVALIQSLRSSDHANPCDRADDGFCMLCVLRQHIELSLSCSGRTISPFSFVDNLSQISSYFQRHQQEDAHEFQQAMLDKLERCSLDPKSMDTNSVSKKNIVDQVFGGRLVSKLQCCNCGHCSYTHETLIDLSLEIEHVDNLSAALESFTNVEKMEDPESKFRCEKCNEEVSIEKQLLLEQAPNVAALHLKRFKSDGLTVEKIDKHVSFPLELDMQPFTSDETNDELDLKYQLYAIVVHIGVSPTWGHYFSFVRTSPGVWHKFDDSKVTRVSEDYVLAQDAYILFYAREDTPWFSSLMEAQNKEFDPSVGTSQSPKSVLDKVDNPCTSYLSTSNSDNRCNEPACNLLEISFPASPKSCEKENCENEVRDRKECTTASPGDDSLKESREQHMLDDIFHCLTPPASPPPQTPDTLRRRRPSESADGTMAKKQRPKQSISKRQVSKVLEDPENKEAFRYLNGMPNKARAASMLNALMGSRSPISRKTGKRRVSAVRPVAAPISNW